ncbi:MAG: ABC transporter substrate-binding protein/permease [Elusimicrobiota bacterium]|nr:ABC transporter substrate-binding protein/permease [Elusimicrobiota bacterium]
MKSEIRAPRPKGNGILKQTRTAIRVTLILTAVLSGIGGTLQAENKKSFSAALTGKFPPFSYYDKNGELTGFDVDVAREIARRMGRDSKIITTDWDGILAGLLSRKYDSVIGSMAVTPKRAAQVNFSKPYYHSGAQLFVHRENPDKVYGIDECGDKRIAVVLGETYQHYLETNYPNIKTVTLKSTPEIFELLDKRRITGFVTDKLVGEWQIKSAERSFVPVGEMLYREDIAIPVRKEETRLLSRINTALDGMRKDGTLRKISGKYFGLISGKKDLSHGRMTGGVIAKKLLKGFAITLQIASSSILIGFILSIPCGLLLRYGSGVWFFPHLLVRTIVDFLRATPVLIQLLFVWMGLGLSPIMAAVVTLSANAAAYMSEVIRSGLMSVNPGQARAAQALGLSAWKSFRYVVWPQAFRIAIPTLMNSVVSLVKDTALVAIISIPEVIREAQSIISVTFEPAKYYFIAALLFFVVTFPLMKLSARYEAKIKQKGYTHD